MGQLDLGFEHAGFEVVAAYEFWEPAVEVWNANRPEPRCRLANVKDMGPRDVPEFDLLIGGPPCQPFTQTRNQRTGMPQNQRHGSGIEDSRNCIPDFLRIAAGRPFLMENVDEGLLELHGVYDHYARRVVASNFGDVTHRRRWFYSNEPFSPDHARTDRRFRHPDPRLNIAEVAVDDDDERYFENRFTWHDRWSLHPNDDGFFGTITTGSHWVKTNIAQRNIIPHPRWPQPKWPYQQMVRTPSVLEMMRAHSIPETWNWGRGPGQMPAFRLSEGRVPRGREIDDVVKMIGNGVPVGMATAVAKAVMRAQFPDAYREIHGDADASAA